MATENTALKYVRALQQVVRNNENRAQVYAALRTLIPYCKVVDVHNVLLDPLYTSQQKVDVLQRLLPEPLPSVVIELLKLVFSRHHAAHLIPILEALQQSHRAKLGHEVVYLTTAVPLPNQLWSKFEMLAKKLSHCKTLELINKVSPELIGGYQLQVGDRRIDASLSNQLERWQQRFINTTGHSSSV